MSGYNFVTGIAPSECALSVDCVKLNFDGCCLKLPYKDITFSVRESRDSGSQVNGYELDAKQQKT